MHYNDLKHALYNTHFCFFIFFALFRWMQSESIRFTCVQWYVKIQQVRASTSKHIMIYDDIWRYISIARALENWLTQETTREPRGRRIREGSVLNRPLLALPGLYQVVQILWISMMFDDIWWYLMLMIQWHIHIVFDLFDNDILCHVAIWVPRLPRKALPPVRSSHRSTSQHVA